MKKNKFITTAKNVIQTEIESLQALKNKIDKNFVKVIDAILNCKNGKVIISGVGKSGIIAKKISSTLSSVGTPSFFVDANSCSHGDMGQISSGDLLILISLSGESTELKNIIQYANRNKKITLIGITSKKNSTLYKNSDISLIMPQVKEAGPGKYIPTSSTITQLSLGDAIAVCTMISKKISENQFKKFHPSGSLGAKLKTVNDLMSSGYEIPFINENINLSKALKIMTQKKLGVLIIRNSKKITTGIITDGQLRRTAQKFKNFTEIKVKKIMTNKPLSIDMETLASKALSIMNEKKITSLCVHKNKRKKITIGIIHIHQILQANIQ
jgi:arabinose-5-phosphate isomerase|tara:strand:- start:6684 stop:7664 length:981 start_codon:yes stop_codon:yes gene_type:complete